MSGIAVLLNGDGLPVNLELVQKMADATACRGPDGLRIWHDGRIALIHAHFWTTPEEAGEEQPIGAVDDCCWVTADARIDNREELLAVLPSLNTTATDSQLILACYQRWGDDCTRHLVGDFAFALWDGSKQQLFCARDPLGVRQFHYSQGGDTFVAASGVDGVLAALGSVPPVNRMLIGDMLAGNFDRWVHETAYQGIFRLPPSHQLTVNRLGKIELKRYWILGSQSSVRFKHDAEYVDCFKELFQKAVNARLRSHKPVGIFVSGGLDSSSVACTADQLLSKEAGRRAFLYSCVFDNTPAADEREYLAEVIQKCSHLQHRLIPADGCWGLREFAGDNGFPLYEPEIGVDRSMALQVLRAARRDDCRVIMGGHWGDHALGAEPYHRAVVLRDVEPARLLTELKYFVRKVRRPFWYVLAVAYLRPLVPRIIQWALRSYLRPPSVTTLGSVREPAVNFLPPPPFDSQSALATYLHLTNGLHAARMLSNNSWATYLGIEWSFPFLDRRLIDFMLSVPPRLRFRKGLVKYILREAMAGILPEKIRNRTTAADFTPLVERGLRENEVQKVNALLQEPELVRCGYVDQDRLSRAWISYRRDRNLNVRPLIYGLCAEAWLRSQSVGRTRSIASLSDVMRTGV